MSRGDGYKRVGAPPKVVTADIVRSMFFYDPQTGAFCRRRPLQGHRVTKPCGFYDKDGYLRLKVNYAVHPAHRLAWLYVYGEWPDGYIDHINRIKSDNRIANLRVVDAVGNSHNCYKALSNSSTGLRGVSPHRGKFRASIMAHGIRYQLGEFDSAREAHRVYLEAKERMHNAPKDS